jgi:hypothetical protein
MTPKPDEVMALLGLAKFTGFIALNSSPGKSTRHR